MRTTRLCDEAILYFQLINSRMTAFIYFIIFCVQLFDFSIGYVNLALHQPAWQTTNYSNTSYFALAAVDGNTSTKFGDKSCALITATTESGEWRVDLGEVLSIYNIIIYYRNDRGVNTWRMAGFFLYVSNTTNKDDGHLCFHEIQTSLPPNPMTITCIQHARYVIYYNERNNPAVTYPLSFSKYLWNELCEVQVYGCTETGFYGVNCDNPCPENCENPLCEIVNGHCFSCIIGYEGPSCDRTCSNSTYGKNCSSKCGQCRNGVKCYHINGTCPNGCAAGWREVKCDTKCHDGTYGLGCNTTCSIYCKGTSCNHVDGKCDGGCKDGWAGHQCNSVCPISFYGGNCESKCGHCYNATTCNHVLGTCPNGCAAGWLGMICKTACPTGKYGLGCNKNCSKNCKSTCDNENGTCDGGCKDGWEGDKCDEDCRNSFYGQNCESKCGQCLNGATCHHVNGTCTNGCAAGWKELKCDQVCVDGTYGLRCDKTCSVNCQSSSGISCHHVNGNCTAGCNPGYEGARCDRVCDGSYYGENCKMSCGNCSVGHNCNHINGTCPAGCREGWQGDKCDAACTQGTFGLGCDQNCSKNCYGNTTDLCDHVTGSCKDGCFPGWQGSNCITACDDFFYGKNCMSICKHCLNGEKCNHVNGTCEKGCAAGWEGEICDKGCESTFYGENCKFNCSSDCVNQTCYADTGNCFQKRSEEPDIKPDEIPTAAIGGVVGGLLFVSVLAIAFVLFRRYKGKKAEETESNLNTKVYSKESKTFHDIYANVKRKNIPEIESKSEIEADMETVEENTDAIYANSTVRVETYSDIPVSKLEQVIIEKRQNDEEGFKQEYTSFPMGETCPCGIGKMELNVKKNRFKTTFPYDHSRVVLKTDGNETEDYINANYIDGMENEKQYIGSQGPKQGTIEDFWRMIWQENVTQVVMLTNLKEGLKEKCAQYWPDSLHHALRAGRFSIVKTVQKEYSFFVLRQLTIKHTKLEKQRTVTQFHYTAWPDHGIPDTLCLVEFHSCVMRTESKKFNSPLVVHCSAGIGRTGTYIALDALYKYGVKYGKVNIAEYVKIMRKDRMNMVQTREQYITIYLTLCEAFKASVNVIPVAEFVSHFAKAMKDAPTNQNPLRKEMQTLMRIKRKYSDSDFKFAKQNGDPKGTGAILPLDKFTLHLMTSVPNRGSYINAIVVPSFTKLNYFIVTPYPTQDTAVDLLRLIADQQSTIVVVTDPVGNIDSSPLWLPRRSSTVSLEPFSITCKSFSNQDGLDTSIIQISNTQKKEKLMEVSVLAPRSSISVDTGSDITDLRELVNAVLNSDSINPVIVMSRDAALQCGLFCAVFNVIQQMRLDDEIDIFTAVRQLQIRRPEFCSSIEEYRACYQTIADQILYSSDHLYSN